MFMTIINNLFNKWGLFSVFILIALEYACFPLPSELILPFAGFITSINQYSIIGVIILSTISGYVGCLICYLVGYYGGNYLYNIIYNKKKKWRRGLDNASVKFRKYGCLSVFICRLIPLCRTYISFFAGTFKQGLFKYSLYSVLGILIWNSFLIVLGHILMNNWKIVSNYYNKYKLFILVFVLLFLLFVLLYKMYKKKKLTETINGD